MKSTYWYAAMTKDEVSAEADRMTFYKTVRIDIYCHKSNVLIVHVSAVKYHINNHPRPETESIERRRVWI